VRKGPDCKGNVMMDRQTGVKMSQEQQGIRKDWEDTMEVCNIPLYLNCEAMVKERCEVECWLVTGPVQESINRSREAIVRIVISETLKTDIRFCRILSVLVGLEHWQAWCIPQSDNVRITHIYGHGRPL
jgi:hypothetical protein